MSIFDKELKKLRSSINKIDDKLVKLIEDRFNVVKTIGKLKKKHGVQIGDKLREQEILQKVEKKVKNSDGVHILKKIYKECFKIAKKMQK